MGRLKIVFKVRGVDYGIMWLSSGDLVLADSVDFLVRKPFDESTDSLDQFVIDFLKQILQFLGLNVPDEPVDDNLTIEQKRDIMMEDLFVQLKPIVDNEPTGEGIKLIRT